MNIKQIKFPAIRISFVILLGLSLIGCAADQSANSVNGVQANQPAKAAAPASFINKVWQVSKSNAVAPGQLYVFLSDGTLVIASPNSKPAFGSWTYKDGKLTMTEETRPYQTDILKLAEDEFAIRMNNPGEAVEITLKPADQSSLQK